MRTVILFPPPKRLHPNASCLLLFTHEVRLAFSLAALKAGNSMPARMAMIAMTTNHSIKVNANRGLGAGARQERGDPSETQDRSFAFTAQVGSIPVSVPAQE